MFRQISEGDTTECIWSKLTNVKSNPRTSDGSQFHQPPQVPSCKAHQLPKNKAVRFRSKMYFMVCKKFLVVLFEINVKLVYKLRINIKIELNVRNTLK